MACILKVPSFATQPATSMVSPSPVEHSTREQYSSSLRPEFSQPYIASPAEPTANSPAAVWCGTAQVTSSVPPSPAESSTTNASVSDVVLYTNSLKPAPPGPKRCCTVLMVTTVTI